MKWSEKAWSAALPVTDEILRHPFIRELALGTLPAYKFACYLAQDRIYLENYGREMKALAAMLPEGRTAELYRRFAEDSMEAENALHEELCDMGYGSIDPKPLDGTVRYMRHTSDIIGSGDLALSMAAMLPCMWVYNEVGRHILATAALDRNPYRSWIECYSSPMMDEGAQCSMEMTDELAEKENGTRREEMTRAFITSVECELAFWEQAYRTDGKRKDENGDLRTACSGAAPHKNKSLI